MSEPINTNKKRKVDVVQYYNQNKSNLKNKSVDEHLAEMYGQPTIHQLQSRSKIDTEFNQHLYTIPLVHNNVYHIRVLIVFISQAPQEKEEDAVLDMVYTATEKINKIDSRLLMADFEKEVYSIKAPTPKLFFTVEKVTDKDELLVQLFPMIPKKYSVLMSGEVKIFNMN